MDTTEKIKNKLAKFKPTLKERYPISTIAIFGSYARQEQTDTSDIDILVDFNARIGSRFIDLAIEPENLLGLKVDLISKGGIKDRYFKVIESDLIYV